MILFNIFIYFTYLFLIYWCTYSYVTKFIDHVYDFIRLRIIKRNYSLKESKRLIAVVAVVYCIGTTFVLYYINLYIGATEYAFYKLFK